MKHWEWNSFCLFSLLVFAGSATIWVRSYFVGETFVRYSMQRNPSNGPDAYLGANYGIGWEKGTIEFFSYRQRHMGGGVSEVQWSHTLLPAGDVLIYKGWPNDRSHLRLGDLQYVNAVTSIGGYTNIDQRLGIPLWLFLPAAVPPIFWLRRWRRRGRRGFPVAVTEEKAKKISATDGAPMDTDKRKFTAEM